MPSGSMTDKFTLLVAAFRDSPHVEEVREVGHLDVLDDECRMMLEDSGVDAAGIEHINNTPNELKERVRKAIINGLPGPVMFSTRPTAAATENVLTKRGPLGTIIVLEVPRKMVAVG